jgi:ribonuclease HII
MRHHRIDIIGGSAQTRSLSATAVQGHHMLVTGIDEAGYGPVLGPLSVCSVTFDIPERYRAKPLWSLLERSVTKQPHSSKSDPRLPVCDSKKLHAGAHRFLRLERTASAFLGLAGLDCISFKELVECMVDGWGGFATPPPWYDQGDLSLPVEANRADVRTQTAAVASSMKALGMRLVGLRAVLLPAAEYNRMVAATKNKASVLFSAAMRLVTRALGDNEAPHTFLIDRQGGRTSYAPVLMKLLDIDTLAVLSENTKASRYTLTHLPRLCEIGFYKDGEEGHFPIALASIMAKYLRELSMKLFNRYWCDRVEGLSGTAGYYKDGMRFFSQIRPSLARLGVPESSVLRSR